jgi:hypothetical protein
MELTSGWSSLSEASVVILAEPGLSAYTVDLSSTWSLKCRLGLQYPADEINMLSPATQVTSEPIPQYRDFFTAIRPLASNILVERKDGYCRSPNTWCYHEDPQSTVGFLDQPRKAIHKFIPVPSDSVSSVEVR